MSARRYGISLRVFNSRCRDVEMSRCRVEQPFIILGNLMLTAEWKT